MARINKLIVLVLLLPAASQAQVSDWTQWGGPQRNFIFGRPCHNRRGPVAGQVVARPFVSDLKLRCGPPHCVQSDTCAWDAAGNNNTSNDQFVNSRHLIIAWVEVS